MTEQAWLVGMEGEQRRVDLSQWYSPPDLAEWLWGWAQRGLDGDPASVLEPSAGNGALLRPLLKDADPTLRRCTAVDADPRNVLLLDELAMLSRDVELDVLQGDFMAMRPTHRHDLCLQNPPYEADQDVDFILRGLVWAPVVVGVYRAAILDGQARFDRLWQHVTVERGARLGRVQFGGDYTPQGDYVALQLEAGGAQRGRSRLEEWEWR